VLWIFFLLWLRLAWVQALLVASINSNGLYDVITATSPCPCPQPSVRMRSTLLSMGSHTNDHVISNLGLSGLYQENRSERKKSAITLLQVNTNLTISAEMTKTIPFNRKIFRKNSPKDRMHFDKTSPKNRNPQQQRKSRNATKKSPIARDNRPAGNTAGQACSFGVKAAKGGSQYLCLNENV